jgi:Protein of unknown function (DUF4246)
VESEDHVDDSRDPEPSEYLGRWPIYTVPRNESRMTDWMATQCIAELRYRAKRFNDSPNGAIFVYNGDVFKSDSAVSEDVRLALEEHVKPLEDVPEKLKDWHPGSDGRVLNLVHPSLFPLVYGKTKVLPIGKKGTSLDAQDCVKRCGEGVVIDQPKSPGRDLAYSTKFQWLPCEVDISSKRARSVSTLMLAL